MKDQGSPHVELFSQKHCVSCREVDRYLRERGVAFRVRHVDRDSEAVEELSSRGYMRTPVVRIGDHWMAGFKKSQLDRLLRSLER